MRLVSLSTCVAVAMLSGACSPGPGYPTNLYQAGPRFADGYSGENMMFEAAEIGGPHPPMYWNFGGGATPNESTESYPWATLLAPGTYDGFVKARGQRVDFTYTVLPQPEPVIENVELRGYTEWFPIEYTQGEFYARWDTSNFPTSVTGGIDRYLGQAVAWNFGGGVLARSEILPTNSLRQIVELGAPGTYQGSVTITTSGGSDTFDFICTVEPESRRPQ